MFRKRYHFSDFFWYQGGNTQTPIQCLNFSANIWVPLGNKFLPMVGTDLLCMFLYPWQSKIQQKISKQLIYKKYDHDFTWYEFLLTKGIPFGYRNVRCWVTSNIHWSNVSYNQRLCHSFVHVCRILGKASFKWNI